MIGGTSNEGLMMAYPILVTNLTKPLDTLRNNTNYFAPLYELGMDVDSVKSEEIGTLLKKMYYGCTQPSKTNTEGYFTVSLLIKHLYLQLSNWNSYFSIQVTCISGMVFKELCCHV